MAVLAFIMILFVFMLNTSICPDKKKESVVLIDGEPEIGRTIHDSINHNETTIEKICRLKNSLTANVIVAFLVLTVIRQVMMRVQSTRDRIR